MITKYEQPANTHDDIDPELGIITPEENDNQNEQHDITVWQVANGLLQVIFVKENCPRIASAILISCLSTGLNFLSPALLAESIHAFSKDEETINFNGTRFPWWAIVIALGLSYGLAQAVPNICNQIMLPVTGNNVKKVMKDSATHLLNKSLHYHVNTLPADQFYLIQKGFTLSTIGTPILTQIFPMTIQTLSAGILLSSQYGIELGASLIVLLGIYVGYSAVTAKPIIRANENLLTAFNECYAETMATIERYKIIHDYDKVNHTIANLEKTLSQCWSESFVRAQVKPIQVSYGHSTISYIHMILAAMYVGHGIKSAKYTVQDFVVIVGYLVQLANLMPAFGQSINQVFAGYPDLKFVFTELANTRDRMTAPNVGASFPQQQNAAPAITFLNVTYRHQRRPNETDAPLLFKNLSLTLSGNKLIAIVSESGVGKTTLFHLLARDYALAENHGEITINGQNINDISLLSLRQNIAVFRKDPQLFKGSIRENILFGASNPEEISDEDIENIARSANLYDFLQAFPQQLDTMIAPNGSSLSDGQQQKVAILRGLMKKSKIWLLDEVTSSLDAESATQVLDAIKTASNHVTCLMITHKLHECAQYADEIVVINRNSQITQGTHSTLLDESPLYRNLWNKSQGQSNHGTLSSTGMFSSSLLRHPSENELSQDMAVPTFSLHKTTE